MTFCCCCPYSKKSTDYYHAVDKVEKDLLLSLDLVTFFKRFRAYGLAISVLLDSSVKNVVTQIAMNKTIKKCDKKA